MSSSVPRWFAYGLATLALLGLVGCGTLRSGGERYASVGKHELALPYLIGVWRMAPDDQELSDLLMRTFRQSQAHWSAQTDRMREQGELRAALGAAKRWEIWSHVAGDLGLQGFSPVQAAQEVARLEQQVADEALKIVDEGTASGVSPADALVALRTALGVRPHDGEIQRRYESLRRRLNRRVGLRLACANDARSQKLCRRAADRLRAGVTVARRELAELVWDDEGADTVLVVQLDTSASDSGWRQKKAGTAQAKIPELNQYKEKKKNKKGKEITRTVRASWKVQERQTLARSELALVLRSVRGQGTNLLSLTASDKATDTANFYTWSGDHRALESILMSHVTSAGTDQSPPRHPDALARTTVDSVVDGLLPSLIEALEAPP